MNIRFNHPFRKGRNLIIEGVLTTEDANGQPHLAPLGPVVDQDLDTWTLRPFQTSTTFKLLRQNPKCVFQVVDDVLLLAKAILKLPIDESFDRENGSWVLQSCCHWFQLEIFEWDTSNERSEARAKVISRGLKRPFWGWNRAKHAVLEACILATRLHILDRDVVLSELERLETPISKTAGPSEQEAWQLLRQYVEES